MMVEFTFLAPLAAAVSPLLSGAVLVWLIQRGFSKQDEAMKAQAEDIKGIKKRMDCFESARHECQMDVAKNYATKDEVDRFSLTLVEHGERISAVEAKVGR